MLALKTSLLILNTFIPKVVLHSLYKVLSIGYHFVPLCSRKFFRDHQKKLTVSKVRKKPLQIHLSRGNKYLSSPYCTYPSLEYNSILLLNKGNTQFLFYILLANIADVSNFQLNKRWLLNSFLTTLQVICEFTKYVQKMIYNYIPTDHDHKLKLL